MEINAKNNYKLLVIGGTGFIGQHIVKKSLDLGFHTTSLSKSIPNKDKKLKGATYLAGDITNKKLFSIFM